MRAEGMPSEISTARAASARARDSRRGVEGSSGPPAAEAFTLIARALTPRRAVVVHPQFTEPEAALLAAGHRPERLLLSPDDGFLLHPEQVPEDADLVVYADDPREDLAALAAPSLVVLRGIPYAA